MPPVHCGAAASGPFALTCIPTTTEPQWPKLLLAGGTGVGAGGGGGGGGGGAGAGVNGVGGLSDEMFTAQIGEPGAVRVQPFVTGTPPWTTAAVAGLVPAAGPGPDHTTR